MEIWVDSREKSRAIQRILAEFDKQEVKYAVTKLFVGDYMNLDNPRLAIDRKQSLSELCVNVAQDHKRFVAELERAKEFGIKLIILCEHGVAIKSMSDVLNWKNPRLKLSPMAVSGERLYRILTTISVKYDIRFEFCNKAQTGKRIIELLGKE